MNINRKIKKITKVEIQEIKVGACFLWGSPEDLYIRTSGEYNSDTYYAISVTRLKDGLENKFMKTVMVQPVGATVNMEE